MTRKFQVILACTLESGIGKDGTIPWNIPEDMRHFRTITQGTREPGKVNMVIMGRKTWESLPNKPLARRRNVVVTQTIKRIPGAECVPSLDDALMLAMNDPNIENVFVIGGAQLYNEALRHPDCDSLYVTMINAPFDCDTFFDHTLLTQRFQLIDLSDVHVHNNTEYAFAMFQPQSSL